MPRRRLLLAGRHPGQLRLHPAVPQRLSAACGVGPASPRARRGRPGRAGKDQGGSNPVHRRLSISQTDASVGNRGGFAASFKCWQLLGPPPAHAAPGVDLLLVRMGSEPCSYAIWSGVRSAWVRTVARGLSSPSLSVLTLGRSFSTFIQVDADQAVVTRGPYRWVRHPSYTGLLLIALGFGLGVGNWLSLAICAVIPLVGLL